jgi:maltooligosyltrehalose trehalohydrolase
VVSLVRKLLRLRRNRPQLRAGQYFFFNHWERYQSRGVLLFARYDDTACTLVAVNTADTEQTVPFWFPIAGDYAEELHGGDLGLKAVGALQETPLSIPSNYGRIWTALTPSGLLMR